MMRRFLFAPTLAVAAILLGACGDTTPTTDAGGGHPGSGGALGTGGTLAAGGTVSAGGTLATGGTLAAGGTVSAGGTHAEGGQSTTGGTHASGGGVASGGAGGFATGGTTAMGGNGGAVSSGGAGGSTGGTTGTGDGTGQLSPQDAVKLMAPGWNLGNSFDATPNETSWGNPTPTQTLINAVHTAGFKTLRLPVSWTNHIGSSPSYTIDSAWMSKVKQTAQWAIDAGMYVFLNIWWDNGGSGSESFSLFNRNTGAATQPSIVSSLMTGIKNGLASPNSWAKPSRP
jgi:endoglucanase